MPTLSSIAQPVSTAPTTTATAMPEPSLNGRGTFAVVGTEDREFWLDFRQSLLNQVNAIEVHVLGIRPTTAEIRRAYREGLKDR